MPYEHSFILRYRGYYYDSETELYYLQSRYYDSAIGRFINADSIIPSVSDSVYGTNLFSYGFNNPINLQDDNGNWPKWAKKLAAAVAVVVVVAAVAAVAVATAGTGTAVACAAMGAAKGAAVGMVTGAVEGAVSGAITHRITTGSWDGAGQAALNGMADGALEGAITGAISGAITSPYCFVAGTPVRTEDGTKAIETIQPGDKVWAWDEETGDVAIKEVVETYINETTELVHVFVNGEEIITTPSHPFYSPVKGWTEAVHLRAGDILVLVNGEYVVVEKIQHEILESPITVYNFQVEDYHTYYVAASGVLVHNTCDTQRGLDRQRGAKMNNTQKITTPSGRDRIPDYLKGEVMGEAKSVRYLSKSKQLIDMFEYAHNNNMKMFLKIEKWTKMSGPLQDAINFYGVFVDVF